MSKDDSGNPFEELQKQLQGILRQGGGFPGAGTMGAQQGGSAPAASEEDAEADERLKRIRDFSLKPRDVRDYLDRYVIRQDEAKKVLSVAICDHYNHVRMSLDEPGRRQADYSKQNILLLGPTGVGKTYLMRTIARLIGVPFVKADATKFSETGYVGADVEDLVRDLVKAAQGNVELAEYGIIYIDEIDKIASAGENNRDVSGRGVQINLLKLMEDTEVSQFSPNDMMAQMQAMMGGGRGKGEKKTISTRHILFIVSGAFDKLAGSVKKRVEASSIGFASNAAGSGEPLSHYLHRVETNDLIRYGYEPEFVGRLPVRVACDSLSEADLADILNVSEGSVLRQYREDFKGYGIDFTITPEAVREVAQQAHGEGTGARGLMTVLERVFRGFKFELPSTAIERFEVTTETIAEPKGALQKLLVENSHLQKAVVSRDIEAFVEAFEREHGLGLDFDEQAKEVLAEAAAQSGKTLRTVCHERFKDFQHGLQIIHRNTGHRRFAIDARAARDPDKELSRWVVEAFRQSGEGAADADAGEPGEARGGEPGAAGETGGEPREGQQ